MQFMLLIYNDPALLGLSSPEELDDSLHTCFRHTDELRAEGRLLESQMLAPPSSARSVRVRAGRQTTLDGPFAETKEMLGGFNLIEADSIEEAVAIAASFPWVHNGCIEVRPVENLDAVRARVAATR